MRLLIGVRESYLELSESLSRRKLYEPENILASSSNCGKMDFHAISNFLKTRSIVFYSVVLIQNDGSQRVSYAKRLHVVQRFGDWGWELL